jgi:hypothetical protein
LYIKGHISNIVPGIKEERMRNLVVVRAGPKSLHRNWTDSQRSWKLAISSFGADDPYAFPEADYFHYFKGGKWDGIHAFFYAHPGLLDEFDQFWFPDDDIECNSSNIEAFFNLAEKYELELAQPSLTKNSYFTHAITLNVPFSTVRYTNFVELMVPLLNREMLKKSLPLFELSRSGWGIDNIWARMTSDPFSKCAIIDEVSVRHCRPVGSVLAKELTKLGASNRSERDDLSRRMREDLEELRTVSFALVTRGGHKVRGRFLCGLLQFLAQMPWLSAGRHPDARTGLGVFGRFLYAHFAGLPNLRKIDAAQVTAWLQNNRSSP